MPKITYTDLFAQDSTDRGPAIVEALAPLATGLNKDGTAFQLATSFDAVPQQTAVVTAAATAVNDACVVPVATAGALTFDLRPSASLAAGTVVFEASYDGGTNWAPIVGGRQDSMNAAASISWATSSQNYQFEFGIPPLATHIRARVSVATSGGTVRIAGQASAQFSEPVVTVGGSLNVTGQSSAAHIGSTTAEARWYSETISAALAASAVTTGATRDLFGVASGAVLTTSSLPIEFRAFSVTDQAHTIRIEGSDDGTTWDPYTADTAAVAIGSKFVAQLAIKPATRYARVIHTNGATLTTFARLRTTAIGS
jgi:hypothetical protein